MNRMWDSIIKPIIEGINANYIVEIGSDTGINTKNILEYCMKNDARMSAVDPFPQFDIKELKSKYGDKFEIYKELSLSRLPLLKDYDVVLLDGDHNWYTVYNELKIIEKSFKGKKLPLIFLHDVGWPYSRRDLYYNPENIPEAYRQPYKKLGMFPDHTDLKEKGGLNIGLNNAIYENNPKNGVLTAVEDFIDESDLEFSFKIINMFHGLGILYLKKDKINKIVENILKKADLINKLEKERLIITIGLIESHNQNITLQNKMNEYEKERNELIKIKEEKVELEIKYAKSNKHNESLEQKIKKRKNKLKYLESQLNSSVNEKEKLINHMSEKENELNNKINDLTIDFYKMEYYSNKNRSIYQRLFSRFPSLYILFNTNETGIKNALINIKGYRAIKKNNLLDIGFYLKNNNNVRLSGMDPILHYLYHGFKEGRNPSSSFDGEYYLKKYGYIKKSNLNPLVHYSLYGINEGRKTQILDEKLMNYEEILDKNKSLINLHLFKEGSPLVSIIILNRNGYEHLKRLFKNFKENIQYPSYEIIVVDNASKDNSLEFLEGISDDLPIKIIKNNKNVSFSRANNQGVEIAKGEYLLLLNNDVEPLYGWLNQMMQTALKSDDIGAVGAKLVYPNVSQSVYNKNNSFKIQHAGIAFFQKNSIIYPYNIGRGLDPFNSIINSEKEMAGVTAAALLVKKDKYLKIGGLDEEYYYGYEDVDFCLKLLKKGYKNVYCPKALIFHYEHGTDEIDEIERREKRRIANENIFIKKWNNWLYNRFLLDKIENNRLFSEKPLKVALAVTEYGENTSAGDYFTALEFSEALKKIGYEVSFLPQKGPENWYEVSADVDVLISFLHSYNPNNIKCSNSSLIKIAWPRNWFDKWTTDIPIQEYDIILASSKTACEYIMKKTGLNPILMPIGTNKNRFNDIKNANKKYLCDYCFTGSYWHDSREIIGMLDPKNLPYKFNLYGKNWENVEELKDYCHGFINYENLPEVYSSTKIVIDDANRVTKSYGSVNSRVYDAISSGTLVITNGELGAKETFQGKLPSYRSKEELEQLIKFYLTDEDARIKKIKELQKFVLQNHTYDHRAKNLKNTLKDYVLNNKVLFKSNFITDPSITLPYLESKNLMNTDYLKVAVFIEGELRSLKSCPYLRLYSPLKELSLNEKFKIFIYDREAFPEININNILQCKLFDVIIIQRGAIDIKASKIILKKCKDNNIKVIYELDDDLLSIDENNRNYAFFKKQRKVMEYLLKNSDLITVTTDALSKRFNNTNNTSIVRNYLVNELMPMKSIETKNKVKSIDIGYFGTITHDDDLLMIKDPIYKIINKFKENYDISVNLHIIGGMDNNHEDSWFTKVEVPDDSTDFVPFMNWIKRNAKFDIMIAPLKDTTFNHAKSELKYIEYTALGMPGIYSDLPPYNTVVKDGINGLVAKNKVEWEEKLEKLILDEDLRIKIVKNAQKHVKENYLLKNKAEEWGNILQNITQKEEPHHFKISIIIPIYNMEKYLMETLESIENQSIGLENLEVLMINEASSDGSKLIIDEYANKYENFIAVHLPESSGTPGKPRNIGIEMARGEYIMFIDHDDFYSVDACEILYNKISREGVDIVSGIYNFINGSKITELSDKKIFENQDEIKFDNIAEKEELLTLAPVVWSKIYRKSFIEDNNLSFPVGILAEDLIFLSKALLKANGIIFLDYPVYNYRILDTEGETSLSQTRDKKWFKGICNARKIILDSYKKEGKEKYFEPICEYSLNYLLDVFTLSNMNFNDKYEVLDYMYWIIEKANDYEIQPPKRFEHLFNSIIEKDYENAITISETFNKIINNKNTNTETPKKQTS